MVKYKVYRLENLINNKANRKKLNPVKSCIENVEGIYHYMKNWTGMNHQMNLTIVIKCDSPKYLEDYIKHVIKKNGIKYEVFIKAAKDIRIFDKNFSKDVFKRDSE